jgi:hypothetical protein
VILPRQVIRARKTAIRLGLYVNGKKVETIKTSFLGPVSSIAAGK